jgi:protein phosphatase PTC1
MLVRAGQAVALTRDHTAEDGRERERIVQAGGALNRDSAGKLRIGDAGLAVTRGFGDFDVRESGMTPEPEITGVQLEPEDEYIVLACDGLWDVVTEDDVAQLVAATVKEPGMVAKRLVAEAMTKGSDDNITVIVAFLKRMSTAEAVWRAVDA